ncbi:hypothetical protein AQS8620_03265 [Aquimixticola soesokkakensis]|uniref:Uncharacterized protein n=1 Tax=Aquimixticola soesokkakensis TaxID=1519096 RepID=A0A1Y5TPB4_9RHOB|nr:hypothetical protein [Aquimixticola soesokkakensis]SLN68909.1 hypothetical protein AQS8620_03265 [Aquimixticola soesokkakensis]
MHMLSTSRSTPPRAPRRTPRFVAGLVAFSMAMSGLAATPARADEADVVKALGGLLTLYVIGKAVSDSKKSASKPDPVKPKPPSRDDDRWPRDGQRDDRANNWDIPASCLLSVNNMQARHWNAPQRTVVDAHCLTSQRRSAHPLPVACEDTLRDSRGRHDIYDLGCLNNYGYSVTTTTARR